MPPSIASEELPATRCASASYWSVVEIGFEPAPDGLFHLAERDRGTARELRRQHLRLVHQRIVGDAL